MSRSSSSSSIKKRAFTTGWVTTSNGNDYDCQAYVAMRDGSDPGDDGSLWCTKYGAQDTSSDGTVALVGCCGCGVREALLDAAADSAAGGSTVAALLELHRTTKGGAWSSGCRWSFESTDVCTWERIKCDMNGYIGQLNLFSCNLAGSLPPSLWGALSNLTVIDIGHNAITGELPVLSLPKLAHFNIRDNMFTGSLPSFASLGLVTWFHGTDNQFSGQLPELSPMVSLSQLSLSNNELSVRRLGRIRLLSPPAGCNNLSAPPPAG